MSLPKSKILSATKGFTANAEFKPNSPENNTVVNVNVGHPLERNSSNIPITSCLSSDSNPYLNVTEPTNPEVPIYEPPTPSVTRSVETAQTSQQNLQSIITSKDNTINALSLMLDILENNPLIVNRYVVADIDSLTLLISYLTEAEKVDIQEQLDIDCNCSGSHKYVSIDKIYVTKNGETQNFKYQYPNANKILDDHHISVKLVVDRTLQ